MTRDLVQPTFLASYASLIGFCLVTMAILAGLRIPDPKGDEAHGASRPLKEIMARPVFVVAVVVGALGYGVMNLLMTSTPLAMGFCGHPYAAAASVISAHVIAMFGPSFFTGSLIQRFGVLNVMLAGVAAMFACVGQVIPGGTMSTTVTVAVQVLELLFTSVTVRVTPFVPTFEQSKLVLLKTKGWRPQASLLPLFTAEAVVPPLPARWAMMTPRAFAFQSVTALRIAKFTGLLGSPPP